MDAGNCISCRQAFSLPLPAKTIIKLWHPDPSTEPVETESVRNDAKRDAQIANEDGHP
jgi:hypothetical protein